MSHKCVIMIYIMSLVSVPSDPLQSGGSLSEVAASVSSKMAFLEPEQLAQASC